MKVRITRSALDDLERIHACISKDDAAAASRVVTHLINRAMALADTPYQGREVDEPNARGSSFHAFDISFSTPSRTTRFTLPISGIRHAGGHGIWSSKSIVDDLRLRSLLR